MTGSRISEIQAAIRKRLEEDTPPQNHVVNKNAYWLAENQPTTTRPGQQQQQVQDDEYGSDVEIEYIEEIEYVDNSDEEGSYTEVEYVEEEYEDDEVVATQPEPSPLQTMPVVVQLPQQPVVQQTPPPPPPVVQQPARVETEAAKEESEPEPEPEPETVEVERIADHQPAMEESAPAITEETKIEASVPAERELDLDDEVYEEEIIENDDVEETVTLEKESVQTTFEPATVPAVEESAKAMVEEAEKLTQEQQSEPKVAATPNNTERNGSDHPEEQTAVVETAATESAPDTPSSPGKKKLSRSASFKGLKKGMVKVIRRKSGSKRAESVQPAAESPMVDAAASVSDEEQGNASPYTPSKEKTGLKKMIRRMSGRGLTPLDTAAYASDADEEVAATDSPRKEKKSLKQLIRSMSGKGKSLMEPEVDTNDEVAVASPRTPTKDKAGLKKMIRRMSGKGKSFMAETPLDVDDDKEQAPQTPTKEKKALGKMIRRMSGKGKATVTDLDSDENLVKEENKSDEPKGIRKLIRRKSGRLQPANNDAEPASPRTYTTETVQTISTTTTTTKKTITTPENTETVTTEEIVVEEEIPDEEDVTPAASVVVPAPVYVPAPEPVAATPMRENRKAPTPVVSTPAPTSLPAKPLPTYGSIGADTANVQNGKMHYDEEEPAEKKIEWKKPDWTKSTKLRPTGKVEKLREGKLEAPITFLPHQGKLNDGINKKVQPDAVLKYKGGPDGEKEIGWSKPDWTKKPVLKSTSKGSALKSGGEIARPINPGLNAAM